MAASTKKTAILSWGLGMSDSIVDTVASPALWPEPDILNPWLDFFASAIGSLAWPVLIISLALLFRKPIVRLIGRMKSVEAGGAKAQFSDEVEHLAANATKIEPADPEIAKANDTRLQSLLNQAATSPTGAIVEAWKDVEEAAKLLADRAAETIPGLRPAKYNFNLRVKPMALTTHRLLRQYDLLPKAEMSTYEELRGLRNKVAHETALDVTPLTAAQYVKVADQLVDVIKQYTEEFGP